MDIVACAHPPARRAYAVTLPTRYVRDPFFYYNGVIFFIGHGLCANIIIVIIITAFVRCNTSAGRGQLRRRTRPSFTREAQTKSDDSRVSGLDSNDIQNARRLLMTPKVSFPMARM